MTVAPSPGDSGDQLREEAAFWFARMRGDDAADHQAAFESWLSRGAAHRAAYNRIGEMFAEAKVLKGSGHLAAEAHNRPRRRLMPVVAVATVSAVALSSVVSLLGRQDTDRPAARPAIAQTARAVDRSIPLPLGSRAIVDVGSVVVAGDDGDRPLARLETGRARFILIAAQAPVRIVAGNIQFESKGGTLDLTRLDDGSVDAQVNDGEAQFMPATWRVSDPAPRLARIVSGQRFVINPAGSIIRRLPPAGTDWPEGVLQYRGTPLRDVIVEANRYSTTKIVLADQALGDRRISGRFRVDDPAVLAQRLASALALDLDRSRPNQLLLTQRGK